MVPPNLENDLHASLSGSTIAEGSMNSIGNSFEYINHEEVGKTLQALELLLSQARTLQLKDSLERLKLFLNKSNNTPFSVSKYTRI